MAMALPETRAPPSINEMSKLDQEKFQLHMRLQARMLLPPHGCHWPNVNQTFISSACKVLAESPQLFLGGSLT